MKFSLLMSLLCNVLVNISLFILSKNFFGCNLIIFNRKNTRMGDKAKNRRVSPRLHQRISQKSLWMHDLGVYFWPERQRTNGEIFNLKIFENS